MIVTIQFSSLIHSISQILHSQLSNLNSPYCRRRLRPPAARALFLRLTGGVS